MEEKIKIKLEENELINNLISDTISREVAEEFIDELINMQLLTGELSQSVTGKITSPDC